MTKLAPMRESLGERSRARSIADHVGCSFGPLASVTPPPGVTMATALSALFISLDVVAEIRAGGPSGVDAAPASPTAHP